MKLNLSIAAGATAFAFTLGVGRAAERSFADLSIEELLNISVTSVSKKQTKLSESAAAVAVINADEIRRSGHQSIAEMLRLVPGMTVRRINSSEWAISSRGFTNQYANKLLVLVDGRSVYTTAFAGVYWNGQDAMLDDLDRIEVIRGPGATLWGANAVNGVINVTSKPAKETQGGLAMASAGVDEGYAAAWRHGGSVGRTVHYRAYVKYFDRHGWLGGADKDAPDSWTMTRLGSRVDWEPVDTDLLTLQGEAYDGKVGERFTTPMLAPPFQRQRDIVHPNRGGHVLGRWTHHFSSTSDLTAQSYFDHYHNSDADVALMTTTMDFELQHRFALRSHDFVWGAGYRTTRDELAPSFFIRLIPDRMRTELYSAFLQDEITLVPKRVKLTLGSKFERNDFTGTEVQPNVRLLWTPNARQTVWAAVSRAVRTPSRFDHGNRTNYMVTLPPGSPPVLLSLIGSPDLKAERLRAYELGYRAEVTPALSLDLSLFCNAYNQLVRYSTGAPVFETQPLPPHILVPSRARNDAGGETYGAELSMTWRPTTRWVWVASASLLRMQLGQAGLEAETPQHQAQVRTYFDIARGLQLNAAVYYSDTTESTLNDRRVRQPSYMRLDAGVTWQPVSGVHCGLWLQNALDPRHEEFASYKYGELTSVPRTIVGKVTWKF